MKTDAFFALGKQHHVCQDYACAEGDAIVVSDGCSSSPHTDFGARLLARCALRCGAIKAIFNARCVSEGLVLPTESLDATLLMASYEAGQKAVYASMRGDGAIVGRRRDGTFTADIVTFPSGAPFYPSYALSKERNKRYLAEFGGERLTTRHETGKDFVVVSEDMNNPLAATVDYMFSADTYDLVLLLSDGAFSFRRPIGFPSSANTTEEVPVLTVIEEMLAVKTYEGEFITRRAKKFLKTTAAKGWYHDDDFSVAAIYMNGEG